MELIFESNGGNISFKQSHKNPKPRFFITKQIDFHWTGGNFLESGFCTWILNVRHGYN